jgi:hypothetical protein
MPPTVYIKQVTPQVLVMTWQHDVDRNDVVAAFNDLRIRLRETQAPLQIIVDITAKPKFPIQATVANAMHGVFGHRNLERWLVAGENTGAKLIANSLEKFRRRDNIFWFKTLNEAYREAGIPQLLKT